MATYNNTPASTDSAASLKELEAEYSKLSSGFDDYYRDIPDGVYDAVIEEARLQESSGGRPVLVWKLRLLEMPDVHKFLPKSRVITSKTLAWLKEDLEKCSVKLTRLSELPARVHEMEGRQVKVEKRTKEGRMNVFFRWAERGAGLTGIEDDLPF
jgi:hypothetical protein